MPSMSSIDNGKHFDWGRSSKDYAKYRDIYPAEFYEKIIGAGLCIKGQKVLDLGTGTGVLPRNMYKYGAEFVGADIAKNQIEEARRMSAECGMNIEYVVSSAEDINFREGTFDVVTACQCFMYFDRDKVLPIIHRVLKKDGYLCILFMAYMPLESEIAGKSEELILKYNPDWNGAHYNPDKREKEAKTPEWCNGLFELESRSSYEININFTWESWHGRMKACRGIGASSLGEEEIALWEKEHKAYLKTMPENFTIPHWVNMMKFKRI